MVYKSTVNVRQSTFITVFMIFALVVAYKLFIRQSILSEIKRLEFVIIQTINERKPTLGDNKPEDSPSSAGVVKESEDVGSRRSDRGIVSYSKEVSDRISSLAVRKAESRDPELISLVRDIVDLPSEGRLKPSRFVQRTPQVAEVDAILKEKKGGFFIECGALDGERSSNSLYLEQDKQWTGLLIEMDPHYYTQLLGKSRRSWSINACLSPYSYVIQLPFHGDSGGQGRIDMSSDTNSKQKHVPCFPFETLMLAMNRTHIDYFSLDVEGVEFSILQTIPFDKFTIDIMSVEYGHDEKRKNETVKFMKEKGYIMHKDIHTSNPSMSLYVEDFIFVREGIVKKSFET